MYFDFDDRYRDIEPVGSAINRRDGVAVAVIVHLLADHPDADVRAAVFAQQFLPASSRSRRRSSSRRKNQPMFVFVQPKTDLPPLRKPDRVEMSDVDRSARTPEKTPRWTNPLPMAKGNSTERDEATPEEKMRARVRRRSPRRQRRRSKRRP